MRRRRRPANPFRIAVLVVLIGAGIYINQFVLPTAALPFIPTPTPTRSAQSFVTDAETLFQAGKLTQAIESYKQAVRVSPKDAGIYVALSRLQVYTRDYQAALESAENALLLNPNNALAHAYRGWALFFLGKYTDSEAALQQAMTLDNKNPLAHAFYAELIGYQAANDESLSGTMDKAIEESRLARDLGPNLLETHRARGYILEWTDNKQEAIQEFQEAISINKNIADLHLELGIIYRGLNPPDYEKSIEEFNQAIPLNPTDPTPNMYLARTYLQMGQYAKGIQYAVVAINNAPTDPYMYGNLGSIYYKDQQFDKAVENLRLAVRGGKGVKGAVVTGIPLENSLRVLEYYNRYGLALARVNQCNEAAQIAAALIQGVPNDEDTVYNANMMLQICQENITGTATPTPGGPAEGTPSP